MPLPLVYHDDYSPPLPAGHRFPMEKYRLLHQHLRASLPAADWHSPVPCPAGILALTHAPDYIERFVAGALPRELERQLGLPWSEGLVRRTLRAQGGSLLTAELALRHGLACHLAGGTHHAHRERPSGFCVFNDLAVVARYLLDSGRVQRLLIFDCDVHQGDGTATLLDDCRDAVTVSLHCEQNFPPRKAHSDWDIPLPAGTGDAAYLQTVEDALNYLLAIYQPDLVLYDAGVDVHRDDVLGRLALSDAGIAARDLAVLRHCLGRDIPVACVIGGGYDHDRQALARRHGILQHSAARVWDEFGLR
ncbi:histone deacetylase [Pseudomonas stutzeri]|nr:histone deacetylase [Stutzerimonas stutzeri]